MSGPVLIAGLPRSGTTWVGKILSTAQGRRYFFEPDNEKISPAAWLYKQQLHRFPYLTAVDRSPRYAALWQAIFTGTLARIPYSLLEKYFRQQTFAVEAQIGAKTGLCYVDGSFNGVAPAGCRIPFDVQRRRLFAWLVRQVVSNARQSTSSSQSIIKSVHVPLALDWLSAQDFKIQIVLVLRNPHSVYASLKRMRMPDGNRNLLLQPGLETDLRPYLGPALPAAGLTVTAVAFQVTLMLKVLAQQVSKHPDWHILSHDRLCIEPLGHYRQLFQQLGLTWTNQTDDSLMVLNQRGSGFAPARLAHLQPTKWRSELDDCEVVEIDRWVAHFELADFLDAYVY